MPGHLRTVGEGAGGEETDVSRTHVACRLAGSVALLAQLADGRLQQQTSPRNPTAER